MFSHRFRIVSLFGFDVFLDASWLVIAALVVWSLAYGVFPQAEPGLTSGAYLLMGVVGALGFFISIIVHEMTHALVARRFDMPIHGITLFIFGGVAEMSGEPTSPRGEFLMALAGPVASFVLSALSLLAAYLSAVAPAVAAVFAYLAAINLLLGLFNLIPAFPLDGGRMLRAALWGWRKDIVRASRIAATSGEVLAILMIAIGVGEVFAGAFINGLWLGLIGLFLHGAAGASYAEVAAREALRGQPVRRFMKGDPVSVPSDLSLETLVNDYVYRHHHKVFPVTAEGRLTGCVGVADLKPLDPADWPRLRVADISRTCSEDRVAGPDADALEALGKMRRAGGGPLFVTEADGRLVGALSLRDLMAFLNLRLELEHPRADMLRAAAPAGHRPR